MATAFEIRVQRVMLSEQELNQYQHCVVDHEGGRIDVDVLATVRLVGSMVAQGMQVSYELRQRAYREIERMRCEGEMIAEHRQRLYALADALVR